MSLVDPFANPPRRPDFDPHSRTGVPPQARAGRVVQYLLGLVALAILFRAGITVWQFTQEQLAGSAAPANSPVGGTPAENSTAGRTPYASWSEGGMGSSPTANAPKADRATYDLAKARQRELVQLRSTITARLEVWREEVRLWHAQVEPLLKDDAGKALATNATWVRGFHAVYEQPRPELARTAAVEELVADLTEYAQSAVKEQSNAYLPDKAAVDRMHELRAEVDAAVQSYRHGRLQIAALVEESRLKPTQGQRLLGDVLAELKRAERLEEVAALDRQLESVKADVQAKIAAAKEEAIRQAGEAEANKILAAVAEAKAKQQLEEAHQKEEQAKRQRKAAMERDLTEIRRALIPFISRGYYQPDGRRTTEALPMSYTKLAAVGALKPEQEGIRMLLATAANSNDRPRGMFPTVAGGAVEWSLIDMKAVSRAQQLLILHGQAMVENGLLSP
jgi:hypothetical protein